MFVTDQSQGASSKIDETAIGSLGHQKDFKMRHN